MSNRKPLSPNHNAPAILRVILSHPKHRHMKIGILATSSLLAATALGFDARTTYDLTLVRVETSHSNFGAPKLVADRAAALSLIPPGGTVRGHYLQKWSTETGLVFAFQDAAKLPTPDAHGVTYKLVPQGTLAVAISPKGVKGDYPANLDYYIAIGIPNQAGIRDTTHTVTRIDLPFEDGKAVVAQVAQGTASETIKNPSFWSWLPWNPDTVTRNYGYADFLVLSEAK